MWMLLHNLQKNHNLNDEIPSTRHDKLLKRVPVKKWDTKQPHPISHHPRLHKSRLQQTENHICSICTSLHRQYQQYQT